MHNVKTEKDGKIKLSVSFGHSHAEYVAEHMRVADKKEIELATGMYRPIVLYETLRLSKWMRMAYRLENTKVYPIAFFGISQHPSEDWIGLPWMLATEEAYRYKLSVVRFAKNFMAEHTKRFGHMYNYVHSENTKAIRLLEHIGFELDDPEPYGVQGALFQRFHWSR